MVSVLGTVAHSNPKGTKYQIWSIYGFCTRNLNSDFGNLL